MSCTKLPFSVDSILKSCNKPPLKHNFSDNEDENHISPHLDTSGAETTREISDHFNDKFSFSKSPFTPLNIKIAPNTSSFKPIISPTSQNSKSLGVSNGYQSPTITTFYPNNVYNNSLNVDSLKNFKTSPLFMPMNAFSGFFHRLPHKTAGNASNLNLYGIIVLT